MISLPTLAVTGGTGFVGGHLITAALAQGLQVRALARRAQPARDGLTWIEGALDDAEALARLIENTDAVIHIAGVINARSTAEFEAGNVTGTAAVIAAAKDAGVGRFVHVSSLAAREPALSAYGASKYRSEALVAESGLDWTIVRPPAVYGPGDRETLELFRMAARGLILLPPAGRLSVIHVADLARLLLVLCSPGFASGLVLEPDDERPDGWDHREFARAIAVATGREARILSMPASLLGLGAFIDTSISRLRGRLPKLSFDRARYFCHPDWVVSPARKPSADLWVPAMDTPSALAETAGWYRSEGWL